MPKTLALKDIKRSSSSMRKLTASSDLRRPRCSMGTLQRRDHTNSENSSMSCREEVVACLRWASSGAWGLEDSRGQTSIPGGTDVVIACV